MKDKAMILLVGGALIAVGIYLFPLYYGAELFASWTTSMVGDPTLGVIWSAILAGAIIIVGLALVRPRVLSIFGNPFAFAGAIVVFLLCVTFAFGVIGGGA